MPQLAVARPRPRHTPESVRFPGMERVHCVGCGEPLFEYRPAQVRTPSVRPALIIARCKKARCHSFTRVEVPDELTG